MKHVFIVGSRGYHFNYGGWETFVSNLVDNYDDDDTTFHIGMISKNKLDKVKKINNNIYIDPIYVGLSGSVSMLIYTIKLFNQYINYIIENNIKDSYMLILGLKLGNYLKKRKEILTKYNIKTIVNPDGLEHLRSKWNYFVKKFFLYSEKVMLNNCDQIVCDAKGIKKYVDDKFPNLKKRTKYIAYGTNKESFTKKEESVTLKEYGLEKDKYLLMVGRCVPENNYELVINEYMNSNCGKELIIISNISTGKYYSQLVNKTNCLKDTRIRFIDGVYDKKKLAIIRKNAFLYIHGHSVGGTNPSLLEALSLTDLNVLYDVNFNKDIGEKSCLYFREEESLTAILNNLKLYENKREKMGKMAKKIVEDNFTWEIIVNKYKEIFK